MPDRARSTDPLIGDLRRAGLLPLLVLHYVALEPSYGNRLIERIAELTGGALTVNPNTMYPLLRSLDRGGVGAPRAPLAPLLPRHARRRGGARPPQRRARAALGAHRALDPRDPQGAALVPRVSATALVPGRVVEAEELWYDPHRWAAWIDGFGHVAKLEGDWPNVGARLLWDSRPQGRGRVAERVTAYEPRSGQTLAVEDERLYGTQTVAFEPEDDQVRVSLTLEYTLKAGNPLVDLLFIRRAQRDSLQRTLARFGHERRAEVTRS